MNKPLKKVIRIEDAKTICTNPANGEVIAEYPINTVGDLRRAIDKARQAQKEWAKVPVRRRAKMIMKVRGYIVEHMDELAECICRDNGKTRVDAITTDVLTTTMATTYYCKNAAKFMKDRSLPLGNILFFFKWSKIVRIPWGVVGIISPWNYPFSIPYSEVIMALLAGNAVILKAATETQAVGHKLKECIESAGLPEGVFTYINMPGSIAGDAFLEGGVDKLFFTGSTAIGKYLMKKASETLTPLSLELGGNDPMIVCEDADLHRAAMGAIWAGMQNAGQSCGGVERVYVHRDVYDEFLRLLKQGVESLVVGEDINFDTDIGPLTTKRQVETVRAHVRDALDRGATLFATSGAPEVGKGNFHPCVVLTDVDHDMITMKDETFGPVVAVMKVDSIEEAIDLANDSYLGLTGSVWSKNRRKAMKIAREIQSGAITINDHLMSHGLAETPWGGFKQSSIGRSHGDIGFAEMTQPMVIVNDVMPFARKQFWWHPHSHAVYAGIRGVVYLLYGKNLLYRVKGLYGLGRAFFRTFMSDLKKQD
ncbi:MAG: aldehyde dehydrogenase family protein [Spirochaetes bacterium]|nr:aldehyde dehydrogenase family protein [Spirochaetota bacterium]